MAEEKPQDMRTAFHIDFDFNSIWLPRPLFLRIYFNCAGECLRLNPGQSWPLGWRWRAPGTWAKYGHCRALLGHDFSDAFMGITDERTLELIKEGCCPDELISAMLGYDEMKD